MVTENDSTHKLHCRQSLLTLSYTLFILLNPLVPSLPFRNYPILIPRRAITRLPTRPNIKPSIVRTWIPDLTLPKLAIGTRRRDVLLQIPRLVGVDAAVGLLLVPLRRYAVLHREPAEVAAAFAGVDFINVPLGVLGFWLGVQGFPSDRGDAGSPGDGGYWEGEDGGCEG